MNLIRTIQADEKQRWIGLLFVPGPHTGRWAPLYPAQLPFPCRLRPGLVGGRVYLVHRRRIIAFGDIDHVAHRHSTMPVGSKRQAVKPGDTVVLSGTCTHMPNRLQQVELRGFMGPRYTTQDLHTLSPHALRRALIAAGIIVY